MMRVQSLQEVYAQIGNSISKIFVVPLIRYDSPATDYLYLLYESLLNDDDYEIDNVSVFDHFRFVLHAALGNKSILHYHWLEFQDAKALTGMPWKLFCIQLYVLFGGNIVWTIHNLEPHNKRWLKLHLGIHKWMCRKAKRIHVHCGIAVEKASGKFDADVSKFVILDHPNFQVKPLSKNESLELAKGQFEIQTDPSKPVFLMFGNISAYKGIYEMAELFRDVIVDAQLLIVGPTKKGEQELTNKLVDISASTKNIFVVPEFIEEKYIPVFFGISDACIFNFENILTSASVVIAENFNKVIIAPEKGCITEKKEAHNFHLFSSQSEMIEAINRVIATFGYDQT